MKKKRKLKVGDKVKIRFAGNYVSGVFEKIDIKHYGQTTSRTWYLIKDNEGFTYNVEEDKIIRE